MKSLALLSPALQSEHRSSNCSLSTNLTRCLHHSTSFLCTIASRLLSTLECLIEPSAHNPTSTTAHHLFAAGTTFTIVLTTSLHIRQIAKHASRSGGRLRNSIKSADGRPLRAGGQSYHTRLLGDAVGKEFAAFLSLPSLLLADALRTAFDTPPVSWNFLPLGLAGSCTTFPG